MLNIPLSDPTFKDLRDYIYIKSGIYISDTKKYLVENRLSSIIKENNLNSFEDYIRLIKQGSNGNHLNRLFDAVTTNETYFFREPQQFDVLINTVLPKLKSQNKASQTLRIWCAACSTGEEPYTISMMLTEKPLLCKKFEIYASDLSDGVLASAKKGVYNSYAVRNLSQFYLEKYFSNNGHSFVLSPSVKKTVKFMKTNLIDDKKNRLLQGMDIIFCRNVLIYFDTKAKQKAVSNLYDSLNPGGYLFIGSSESLHSVTRAFRPNIVSKVIMYQKV